MEENSNLSKTEAREEVSEMKLPKDRKLLLKKYKRILLLSAQLIRNKLHRDIKKEVSNNMEKKDIDMDRAVSHALNKYRQVILYSCSNKKTKSLFKFNSILYYEIDMLYDDIVFTNCLKCMYHNQKCT